MRVSFHTVGTRGDVQPYMALALELKARGHEVQLVVPAQFADMVRARDLAAVPLSADFLALMDTPEGKAAIGGGKGFSAGFKLLKHVRPLMRQLLEEDWAASAAFAPDLFVYHPKAIAVPHIAERLGRPTIFAPPLPGFTPTAAYPSPLLPFRSLGPLNRWSHSLAINGSQVLFGKLLGQWRAQRLGLGKGRGVSPTATLYGYSPAVFPPPNDWTGNVLVTGYWFLDTPDWQPTTALSAFLAAGPAPVYVGFGSMPGLDPAEATRQVIEALGIAGKRGLLAIGGGALGRAELPPGVFQIEGAPHDKLLPLVSGVVHHGGAGTTAAALRAGRPMVIMPFFGDQPFWARLVADKGLAPAPLDRKTLTSSALATAILAMDDPGMRGRAQALADRIAREDGVAVACDAMEAVGRVAAG